MFNHKHEIQERPIIAKVGQEAPLFKKDAVMPNGEFGIVDLENYRGRWVVLFFYPLDFTFICPTEITGYSKHGEEFERLNAVVLGGSTDSIHSHKAWLKDLGELKFPLFSDMDRSLSRAYNVLIEEEGIAMRGTFIIDPNGILKYALYHDNSIGRSINETLRVLKALQTGELCPLDWEEGKETLGKLKSH